VNSIIRTHKNKNYTAINNKFLKRKDLSMQAKGLLTYILTLPDDWVLYKTELSKHFKNGKSAVNSAFKELLQAGYIVREKKREKGKFVYSYHVFEVPTVTDYPQRINRSGKTVADNQQLLNTNKQSTDKLNTNKDKDIVEYKKIIDYLNEKTGKNYKSTTEKTRSFIRARTKEGFTVEDFKTVIDKKCKQWKNDSKMNRYLRPETLFSTKFEGYLNEEVGKIEQRYKRNSKEDRLRKIKDPANYM